MLNDGASDTDIAPDDYSAATQIYPSGDDDDDSQQLSPSLDFNIQAPVQGPARQPVQVPALDPQPVQGPAPPPQASQSGKSSGRGRKRVAKEGDIVQFQLEGQTITGVVSHTEGDSAGKSVLASINDFDGDLINSDPIPISLLKIVDLGAFAKRKVATKRQTTLTQMLPPKSASAPRPRQKPNPKPAENISRGVRGSKAMTQSEIAALKLKKQFDAAGGKTVVMRRIRDGDIDVFSEIGACLDHAPSSKQFRNKRGLLTSSKPMTRQFSPINKEAKRKIHGRPDNLVNGDDDLSEFQLRAKHVGGKQPGFDSISPKVRINKGDDFAKLCEANFIIVDPSNKVKFFCQCCASRITNKMESVRDHVGVDGKGKPKYKRGEARLWVKGTEFESRATSGAKSARMTFTNLSARPKQGPPMLGFVQGMAFQSPYNFAGPVWYSSASSMG